MKLFFFSNKFPPDDLLDLFRRLRLQAKSPGHVLLRRLLEETTVVVREEIRRLPAGLRSLIPPFQSILDLAESFNWHRGPLSGTFECVFLCLVPLCLFVGDYEIRPHEFSFHRGNSLFTGLGLGFLAATAIVASPSILDVPVTAAEVIRIAFRVGLVLYRKSQDLEPRAVDAPLESWTTVVRGLDEETVREELDKFNTSTETPSPSCIYISVVEPDGSVFVNGPPSNLRKLFSTSERLGSAPRAPLPVYGGPCHAAHLYNHSHSSWVVKEVRPDIALRDCSDAANLLSMADGKPLACQTGFDLFESAAYILLTSIIRWGDVSEAINDAADWPNANTLQLEVFRSSAVVDGLMSTLQLANPDATPTVQDLVHWIFDGSCPPASSPDEKIAVVGMSCRLPGGADDLERFWELLKEGRDVHGKIPADRFDVNTHIDVTGKRINTSQTPFGCFIDNPGLFDAGFFDMSPREAGQTDPTHRLALLTAYEALEQSGYVPDRTRSTTRATVGTIYGQCSDDYREANAGQDIDMYFIPGNYRAFAPGRISYFFKFSGPSFNCDTACSASLTSVQIACSALSRGEADMVVAGGLNIITSSDSFSGLSRAFFLSKTGGCKVFDDGADGYCRADGIGSIVLKRLSDAQQDNDNILGVILATATNHSSAAISITQPHAPTQEELYRNILRQAGVSPLDVDLVEMHGTGTQAGDAAEIESVTKVFCPSAAPRRTHPLHIGSVKANLGHGEAAAGITALIKALLIFQHHEIPKHIGIKTTLNSKFPDLQRMNICIPREAIPWSPSPDRKRYIMVNNFSAAGGNTSLLLEEPPVRPDPQGCPQTRFVVAVSAKSVKSLKANLEALTSHLVANPTLNLANLAYTTTARRMHHNHRIAVHGSSIQDIIKSLQQRLPGVESQPKIHKSPPVAFVFSGQGSFYSGIGRQLFEGCLPYRKEIQQLDEICTLHGFPSILPCISSQGTDHAEATPPLIAQLVTVCVQIALCRLWNILGVTPRAVIGASLGEYAALYAAGVLSASDAIFLVGQRARLLQELCTMNSHSMLAIQATVDMIRESAEGKPYEVSCINAHNNVTIAGYAPDIADIQASMQSQGYRTVRLNVPFAFHSSQVEPLLDRFDQISQAVTFRDARVPVISPLLADVIAAGGGKINNSYLREATRAPVRFAEALEKAREIGLVDSKTAWVEIGVHQAYSSAVRAVFSGLEVMVPSLRADESNWHTLAASMSVLQEAGVASLNWNEWYRHSESELRLLDLPSYRWNLKKHWIQYNGDWLLVKDKGSNGRSGAAGLPPAVSSFRTPLLHHVVEESFSQEGRGVVVMQSDIMDGDFFAVASGHQMSGRPVVSVFAYTDMALSLANYMYSRLRPQSPLPAMDFGNVRILQGLIPRKDRSRSQWVRLRMEADLKRSAMQFSLSGVPDQASVGEEDLATATIGYVDSPPQIWTDDWADYAHLVTSRIETLHQLADQGHASRLSRDMVYSLFKNVVDYAELYRGIQSAVLHGLEAVADVVLAPSKQGKWTAPPHHIDNITHIAGLVLNAGHATDHSTTIYVMDGWKSMRFARPLVPGEVYRSYVKMNPAARDTTSTSSAGTYTGDVHILHGNEVIGLVRAMALRPLPRILMRRFFDPPDQPEQRYPTSPRQPLLRMPAEPPRLSLQTSPSSSSSSSSTTTTTTTTTESSSPQVKHSSDAGILTPRENDEAEHPCCPEAEKAAGRESKLVRNAVALLAAETGVELGELHDETLFSAIGVDSLLSLVLVEKFALELGVEIPGSFFLESPSIAELKAYLYVSG
ncbi:hypothetical protein P175DRAFT_0521075 [Aspergillus ochraceoroseus IBT 24754]|uniref:Uncharacterized protein n=1 Tax=Aspergillus ochraceoroseus IBT 24754 TaxID=1392256 RepID=A0A2T5M9U7_9EURO|nr:uncharacterized protein P175DRAFT_0521075 [Aspergillus ochraceoroseus IBT 24754]PTU25285.1 hypothetical protein P175DRAFT_0521075 [Aspergillus ochraceoroseus IBT 24754]